MTSPMTHTDTLTYILFIQFKSYHSLTTYSLQIINSLVFNLLKLSSSLKVHFLVWMIMVILFLLLLVKFVSSFFFIIQIATAPDGNGGLYMALYKSLVTINNQERSDINIMDHLTQQGVKYIQIYGVDNAIVRVWIEYSNINHRFLIL